MSPRAEDVPRQARSARRPPSARWGGLAALALGVALTSGCGGDPPRCVTVDPSCTPRYAPTFRNLYENTLKESCGSQSIACHSAAGRKGGLSMETAEIAYDGLLAGDRRVVPEDPSCSEVVVRLHSGDASYLMPPGAPLAAADRCAIERWIAEGATGLGPPITSTREDGAP
ncbi:MAG: c-type cytochrome domain-containing protein [Kofleriaceae bacterium]